MRGLFFTLVLARSARATYYSIAAFAPGTAVHGAQLDAAGQAFYAGISGPATYCPSSVGPQCPAVRGTLVYAGMTGMAVEVPGGQQVYVDPTSGGLVRYTAAHSASLPAGSLVGGWSNKTVESACGAFAPATVLDFFAPDSESESDSDTGTSDTTEADEGGGGSLALCPDVPDAMNATGASYALYALAPRATSGGPLPANCVAVVGLTLIGQGDDVGCWQYV
ncbi:hypothetical protein GGR56DRAFT_692302 [Xylariaceae sp. FL0804]|nr:hypothetical protein GGR56DRAFT_692302 [Xylariaceae sp. FL0804]